MRCPECGVETRHGGTSTTLVGYGPVVINGIEHEHDDNCLKRRYRCINGHAWIESIIRTCTIPGCEWEGKKECACHGKKVRDWSDPVSYFSWQSV